MRQRRAVNWAPRTSEPIRQALKRPAQKLAEESPARWPKPCLAPGKPPSTANDPLSKRSKRKPNKPMSNTTRLAFDSPPKRPEAKRRLLASRVC